jgi:hypothetical protein
MNRPERLRYERHPRPKQGEWDAPSAYAEVRCFIAAILAIIGTILCGLDYVLLSQKPTDSAEPAFFALVTWALSGFFGLICCVLIPYRELRRKDQDAVNASICTTILLAGVIGVLLKIFMIRAAAI